MATRLRKMSEIRRENFWAVWCKFASSDGECELPLHGRLKRFSAVCQASARYLTHVINGRREIGDELARAIERGFSKPANWMDHPHLPDTGELFGLALEADEMQLRVSLLRIACGDVQTPKKRLRERLAVQRAIRNLLV